MVGGVLLDQCSGSMEEMRDLPLRLHCVLLSQANVQCTLSSSSLFKVGEGEGGKEK